MAVRVIVSNCLDKKRESSSWMRLTDENLEGLLWILVAEIWSEIERLLKKKQSLMSHQWIILLKKIIQWYTNLKLCVFLYEKCV
jgi:hypothetical protein